MSIVAAQHESDEAFARRLQAQELGAHTPLMINISQTHHHHHGEGGGNANHVQAGGAAVHIIGGGVGGGGGGGGGGEGAGGNPTVINARLNELSTARATVCAILTVNTPQILASFIILYVHWDDPLVCDETHTLKWKSWCLLSALRMLAYSSIVLLMHVFKQYLDDRPRYLSQATSIR